MQSRYEQQWDSVEDCLNWINEQPEPKAALLGIVDHNLDIDEKGFVLDLVTAYLGY